MAFLKNLAGAKKGLKSKGVYLLSGVKQDLEISLREGELMAKREAPVYKGRGGGDLKQSIFSEIRNNGLSGRLTANVKYAPFQEFGTGGAVDIPSGFESLAKPFHTGNGQMSMKAQPYLIPAAKWTHKDLKERLKKRGIR